MSQIIFNPLEGTFDFISTVGVTSSDHALLTNLNWASAGHTIDTDVDFNNHQGLNLAIETVSSLPGSVQEGRIIKLITDRHLYLGY